MTNKYLLIAAIFCIPFLSGNSFSKPGPIYDMSNQLMGYFDEDGTISIHQVPVGYIRVGGVVTDISDTPIGRVDEEGTVTGRHGLAAGHIGVGGVVYDASNEAVGQVDEDGYATKHQVALAKVPDPRVGALMILGVIKIH